MATGAQHTMRIGEQRRLVRNLHDGVFREDDIKTVPGERHSPWLHTERSDLCAQTRALDPLTHGIEQSRIDVDAEHGACAVARDEQLIDRSEPAADVEHAAAGN